MMGSGVFAGVFALDDTLNKRDRDGLRLGDELTRTGFAGKLPPGGEQIPAAYIEAHIEQGPVLEQRGNTIGVVTGVQGIQAAVLTIVGQEAHAGPTPMDTRADALLPAAELVLRLNELAAAQDDARATVGELVTRPGSRNVVPGQVRMTVDLRHPQADALGELWQTAQTVVAELQQRYPRCTFDWSDEWLSPVVPFDASLVERLRRLTGALGYAWQDIVSGAGHDACYVARVAPTAMIFVPCEGGISHNEAERASPEHLEAGANLLLNGLLELASEPADSSRREH
jgi:N-carbamoyl-L-amino-acid hydrolase